MTAAHPLEVLRHRTGVIAPAPPIRLQVPPALLRRSLVDHEFVRRAHGRGLAVDVWTIDEEADMHRLLDLGVDGIMTDRPSLLRAVLRSRGLWSVG